MSTQTERAKSTKGGGHGVQTCACGAVVARCRCMDHDERRVVQQTCEACQPKANPTAPEPTVPARALLRGPEGWMLVELSLPESVARHYATKVDGPHDGATAIGKLENWVTNLCFGSGR